MIDDVEVYNVVPVITCKWLLKDNEDARSIARVAYGNPNKYSEILKANTFKWEPGMRIAVPNVSGLLTNKYPDEGDLTLLRRMRPESDPVKYLEYLYHWNGKRIEAGDYVYLPKK
jgi:hypothetical protein